MDPIIEALSRWADRLAAAGKIMTAVIALVAAAAGSITVGYLSAVMHLPPPVAVLFGALAGGALFIAGFLAWDQLLPASWRARLHLRQRIVLSRRRQLVLWAGLAWFAVLLVVGQDRGGPALGAVNVAVLLMLWRVGTSTSLERAQIEAALTSVENTWDDSADDSDADFDEDDSDDDDDSGAGVAPAASAN